MDNDKIEKDFTIKEAELFIDLGIVKRAVSIEELKPILTSLLESRIKILKLDFEMAMEVDNTQARLISLKDQFESWQKKS